MCIYIYIYIYIDTSIQIDIDDIYPIYIYIIGLLLLSDWEFFYSFYRTVDP